MDAVKLVLHDWTGILFQTVETVCIIGGLWDARGQRKTTWFWIIFGLGWVSLLVWTWFL